MPLFIDPTRGATTILRDQLADLAAVNDVTDDDVLERFVLPSIPQRQPFEVQEITALARFLASDDVVIGLVLPISMKFGPDGALYTSFPAVFAEGVPVASPG